MKGCFVCKKGGRLSYVYGGGRMERINRMVTMCEEVIDEENIDAHREFLKDVEVLFCAWDMVEFTKEQIAQYFPSLKVVFYAAGSVRYFAQPFLEMGIKVLSAWRVMAVPVAQFTLALITLGNKGALLSMDAYRKQGYTAGRHLAAEVFPGTYKTRVGILGAGAIGSLVIQMLAGYDVELMVYDPFLSKERMTQLGLERTYPLAEIFETCQTVSCHIANNPQTVGMLHYGLFSRMPDTACFINTGRGAQVVEEDLIRALREKPLRSALLDVTDPEPVRPDSPLLTLPNVTLFPHVAGGAAQEVYMFPDHMTVQLERYMRGEMLEDEVTLAMLPTMM